jgi:predicted dehydrogenase
VRRRAVWRWDYVTGRLIRDGGADAGGERLIDAPPEGFARNDLFLDHMRHFLARVADSTIAPACSLEDGIAVLEYALAARRSSAEGRQIDLATAE